MNTLNRLQDRIKAPLPGKEAQFRMAHAARQGEYPVPDNARRAGVLALLYPDAREEWNLALIQRVSNFPGDRHGGQIAFPGGGYEENDGTMMRTALRETQEEIGVDASQVHVLGPLTELYIPVSNYMVYPFVGILPFTPVFTPQRDEVDAIVEAPLASLIHPETRKKTDLLLAPNILLKDVPCFKLEERIIWGATAMMISELLALLEG